MEIEKKAWTWKEWTGMGVALAALVALVVKIGMEQARVPDRQWGKAPSFRLEDRGGRMVSNDDLKGRYWVADFIFTRCATSCPVLSQEMRGMQKAWRGNPKVDFVTFTVDPEYDTVKVLKQYADDLGADPKQWFFLTGGEKEMQDIAQNGFHLTAVERPNAQPGALFMHSTRFVLVDPRGVIRGYYSGVSPVDVRSLKDKLKAVLD